MSIFSSMNIVREFPIFNNKKNFKGGRKLVYLDSSATSQKPRMVIRAIKKFYEEENANVHRGLYDLSENATEKYEEARRKVSAFINGRKGYTIFTKGTTDSLNMIAFALGGLVKEDEYVLTSEIEHHSNFLPWRRLCTQNKANLALIEVPVTGKILLENVKKALDGIPKGKLRVLAITHCSNVTGFVTDIKKIAKLARKHSQKVVIVVDGAQAVAHFPVDVEGLGVDFYAFSGHKMYGPMGIGILWGRKALFEALEPVYLGGGMIQDVSYFDAIWAEKEEKWEAGTPNVAGAIGLGAAVDFIEKLGWDFIQKSEEEVKKYLLDQLKEEKIIGGADIDRTGVISLYMDKIHPHDIAEILSEENIAVRAGHHCVQPFHKKLGIPGSVRASLGVYNTKEDIDRLVEGLKKVRSILI